MDKQTNASEKISINRKMFITHRETTKLLNVTIKKNHKNIIQRKHISLPLQLLPHATVCCVPRRIFENFQIVTRINVYINILGDAPPRKDERILLHSHTWPANNIVRNLMYSVHCAHMSDGRVYRSAYQRYLATMLRYALSTQFPFIVLRSRHCCFVFVLIYYLFICASAQKLHQIIISRRAKVPRRRRFFFGTKSRHTVVRYKSADNFIDVDSVLMLSPSSYLAVGVWIH